MIKNHILLSLRTFKKYRNFTVVNILGLSLGIASFILVVLYLDHEWSFDRFHSNYKRTHLITVEYDREDQSGWGALTPKPLAAEAFISIPEVESYLRMYTRHNALVKHKEGLLEEPNVILADSNFFSFFDFELLSSNGMDLLNEPNTVVISESIALKYFGRTNVLGSTLDVELDGQKLTACKVTGVMRDMPTNSHIQGKMIFPLESYKSYVSNPWTDKSISFLKLKQPDSYESVKQKLAKFEKNFNADAGYLDTYRFHLKLTPLKDLHLFTSQLEWFGGTNDVKWVVIYSIVALVILIIAAVNYVNISIAKSLNSIKEISVSKIIGASKVSMIWRFMIEAFIYASMALIIGLLLVETFLPHFNEFTDLALKIDYLGVNSVTSLICFLAFLTLVCGLYPALVLSNLGSINLLKDKSRHTALGGTRKALIIFQFFICQALVAVTIIMLIQMDFMNKKSLGFNNQNLLVLELNGLSESVSREFKADLVQKPGVVSLTLSNTAIGAAFGFAAIYGRDVEGFSGIQDEFMKPILYRTDNDFISTHQMEMAEGRWFDSNLTTDSDRAIVINEAAAGLFEWENPIGKKLKVIWEDQQRTVIGVVKDFNTLSFKKSVEPAVFVSEKGYKQRGSEVLTIRLNEKDRSEFISALRNQWENYDSAFPMEWYFIEDRFTSFHSSENKVTRLFMVFSTIALFIASLGVFGLASLSFWRRLKEMGIRRVLGASGMNLFSTLSRETIVLFTLSSFLSIPLAYYFSSKWLSDFVYRVNTGAVPFVLACLLSMLLIVCALIPAWKDVFTRNLAEILQSDS